MITKRIPLEYLTVQLSINNEPYYIVTYHHIDDLSCNQPLNTFIRDDDMALRLRHSLTSAFTYAGWEGDGEIAVIHIPPFITGKTDGHNTVIFHVKQANNGTSFLAIPYELLEEWMDSFGPPLLGDNISGNSFFDKHKSHEINFTFIRRYEKFVKISLNVSFD